MRRVAVLLAALVGAGVHASQASAAIVLFFDRQTAHPGQRVSVYTGIAPGQPNRLFPLRGPTKLGIAVYLVPLGQARVGLYSSPARSWVRVGELAHDGRGVGRLTFVVPRIRPGRYTTAVCRPCGGSHRGTFIIAGALRGSSASYRASVLRVVLL